MRTAAQIRASRNAGVKRLHGRRRKKKRCINRDDHGRAYRGGRCKPCWEAKLAAERTAYAEGRR